ncbi:hypothetical protein ACFLVX_00690 [Chloroflexota bacterium]
MSEHILKGLAVLLTVMLVTTFAAAPVFAAELRSGGTVAVARGEVIDGDLYIAGGDIIVDGTINGDLLAAGGTINVNGTVNGSVMAAGGRVTINGDVTHAVRVSGGTLNISGNVGGDLLAGGGDVYVGSTAMIGGDLLIGAGNVRIYGLVEGDIKGGGGEVTLANGVKGDIEFEVDRLTIVPTADIRGNLSYTSKNEADIQSGAQISGTTTHKMPEAREAAKAAPSLGIVGKVIGFLMALVMGTIIILVAPRRTTSIADSIRNKPWPSLGWGAIILFATPIAALLVCITVIGIPLGLISLALYGIAIYLTQIPVGLLIGRWIIGYFREVETKAILVGALASGLAILTLLKLIPYLGFVIGLAAILLGLGALLVSERRLRVERQ